MSPSSSSISSIKNSDGILVTDKKEIINEFKKYYQNLYCKADFNCSKLVDLFQLWKPKINEEDIIKLTAEITIKELKFSVFASDSNKSSGPDGISNLFFKKAFKLINNNLLNTFNNVINFGNFPDNFKDGIITTLFKKGDIHDISNRRPITLLNSDYKFFSSIIDRGLEVILFLFLIIEEIQKVASSSSFLLLIIVFFNLILKTIKKLKNNLKIITYLYFHLVQFELGFELILNFLSFFLIFLVHIFFFFF